MAKEQVLVIEDEADIQELLRYNLTKEGYRVTLAASGEEGLKLARAERPDLILLDLMLPGMGRAGGLSAACRRMVRPGASHYHAHRPRGRRRICYRPGVRGRPD